MNWIALKTRAAILRFGLLWGLCFAACSGGGAGDACRSDADCPAGRYCRESTRTCDFDCTYDSECPGDYHCDLRGRCAAGCSQTNGGVEACDEIDNDCDGLTDEDFVDLGLPCGPDACSGIWVCAEGGMATACTAREPAADDATCDGFDDDCDGLTDEDAQDRDCPLQAGVCEGARQNCLPTGAWSECDYGADYTADLDESCDRQDNDCDGQTDEDAAALLIPEADELANDGLDNNCNGLVDEPGGVLVPAGPSGSGWIDAYEIGVFSQADCGGQQYGIADDDYPAGFPADDSPASTTLYACSLKGIMPSGYLSWHRARRACEAQGLSLCTVARWSRGCYGEQLKVMPYGIIYSPGVCNDAWAGSREKAATGAFPDCTAGTGTFDMTGNMAEWIDALDEEHPGNAWLATIGYSCTLCNDGAACHVCVQSDEDDFSDFQDADSCLCQEKREQSFPQETTAPDFGARCCLAP